MRSTKKLSAPPSQIPHLNGTVAAEVAGAATLHSWDRDSRKWIEVADGRALQGDGRGRRHCVVGQESSSTVLKPDYFRMDVQGYAVPGESSVLLQLKGGNAVVK